MRGNTPSEPELVLLGRRQYVQAPLQLHLAFCRLAALHGLTGFQEIRLHRCKQIEEVDSPLELAPLGPEVDKSRLRMQLAVEIRGRAESYCMLAAPGGLRRLPDPVFRQTDFSLDGEDAATANLPSGLDFWALLNECVQLAKVFHQGKYASLGDFRFVVGGFEELAYAPPPGGSAPRIRCAIARHHLRQGTIYNQLNMSVIRDGGRLDFRMPFLGRPRG